MTGGSPAGSGGERYAGLGARVGSARGEHNVTGRLDAMASLRPLAGTRLLDIGCGNGAYTLRMAPGFAAVTGIDLEPDRIGDFRAAVLAGDPVTRSAVEVVLGSASKLAEPDGHFDVVTAIETLEHLGGDLDAVLDEVARVLAPGGTFYLTTPNRWWPLEQHGVLLAAGRRPGWRFPLVTWVPAIHRRFSDSDAFTPWRLDRILARHGFHRAGLTYLWPPMDSHPGLRRASGPVLRAASGTALRRFAQTLVMTYRRA